MSVCVSSEIRYGPSDGKREKSRRERESDTCGWINLFLGELFPLPSICGTYTMNVWRLNRMRANGCTLSLAAFYFPIRLHIFHYADFCHCSAFKQSCLLILLYLIFSICYMCTLFYVLCSFVCSSVRGEPCSY